jgi:hypothetical protein
MIDRDSPAGSWAALLPFCRNIQITENTGGGLPNGDCAAGSDRSSVHESTNNQDGGQNHGG